MNRADTFVATFDATDVGSAKYQKVLANIILNRKLIFGGNSAIYPRKRYVGGINRTKNGAKAFNVYVNVRGELGNVSFRDVATFMAAVKSTVK